MQEFPTVQGPHRNPVQVDEEQLTSVNVVVEHDREFTEVGDEHFHTLTASAVGTVNHNLVSIQLGQSALLLSTNHDDMVRAGSKTAFLIDFLSQVVNHFHIQRAALTVNNVGRDEAPHTAHLTNLAVFVFHTVNSGLFKLQSNLDHFLGLLVGVQVFDTMLSNGHRGTTNLNRVVKDLGVVLATHALLHPSFPGVRTFHTFHEQDFDTSVSGVSGGAGASVPAVNRQVVSANSANFHHFLSEADNVSLTENGAVGHGQGRGFVVHLGGQLRFVREQFVLNPFVFRVVYRVAKPDARQQRNLMRVEQQHSVDNRFFHTDQISFEHFAHRLSTSFQVIFGQI